MPSFFLYRVLIVSVISCFCLFSNIEICYGDTILLVSEAQLDTSRVGEDNTEAFILKGFYKMSNEGNTSAIDVTPVFQMAGWSWTGEATRIDPGDSYTWMIDTKIPKDKLQCVGKSPCASFELPLMGAYPLVIMRYYKDLNAHQFSLPDVYRVVVGELDSDQMERLETPSIDSNLVIDGDGQSFNGKLTVLNRNIKNAELDIQLFTSDDIEFSPHFSKMVVPPVKEKFLDIKLKNLKALDGNMYPVIAIVSWEHFGFRNFLTTFALAKIHPVRSVLFGVLARLGCIGFVLVVSFFMLRDLKRKEKLQRTND